MKKRILFCGEASFLNTGFSTYYRELLARLAATGKYDIAEMGCIPEDCVTKVLLADGFYKDLKKIRIGDLVVTHNGRIRTVTNTFRRSVTDEMIYQFQDELSIGKVQFTGNHLVLAFRHEDILDKYSQRIFNDDITPSWMPASELKKGDYLVYPKCNILNECCDEINAFGYQISFDDDFALFLGWYLAEGSLCRLKRTLSLAFCSDEKAILDRIVHFLNDIGIHSTIRAEENYYSIIITEWRFVNLIASLCGRDSYNKYLSASLLKGRPEFILKIIAAYIKGDGHWDGRRITITSVSKELLVQVKYLLSSYGIASSLSSYNTRKGFVLRISRPFTDKICEINGWEYDSDHFTQHAFMIGDYFLSKIKKKTTRQYTGHVLNIEVEEDDSYIVNDRVCHNSYAHQQDPRVNEFIKNRWKFYGVLPQTPEENAAFNEPKNQSPRCRGQNTWQFGDGKFPLVCADFKPDIVVDIRDWWMLEYIERSPFRHYFKWLAMPTVDAEPQKEDWVGTYKTANMVLAYSDFGVHVLKQYPGIKIYTKPMRPGVDLEMFRPRDRAQLKEEWLGSKDNVKVVMEDLTNESYDIKDANVIMMLARNQARKLYPDALDAFGIMKNKYKGESVVDKAIFIIHASWPDNAFSYDYPTHINRMTNNYYGLQYYYDRMRHDVMQTFICHDCGFTFLDWAIKLFDKPIENRGRGNKIYIPCQKCRKMSATTPDTSTGYDREQLAQLYAMADMMVQVTICEGDGMPIQEAKACGTPVLSVDYSAMAEKARFCSEYAHMKDVDEADYTVHHGGIPIPVERFYQEPETSCKRALPDREVLADQMYKLLKDDERRQQLGVEARKCAESNYDWDDLAERWEYVLDNVKPLDRSTTWDKPHDIRDIPDRAKVPEGLNDEEFIEFLYLKVLTYPSVDPNGKKHWMSILQSDQSREQVYEIFYNTLAQEAQRENVVNGLLNRTQPQTDGLQGEIV